MAQSRSNAENWNAFWRDGYGSEVVNAVKQNCDKRIGRTILEYLYKNEYPNPVDSQLELIELKRELDVLLSKLKIVV